MSNSFEGDIAVVTGASGQIGPSKHQADAVKQTSRNSPMPGD
ncbi:hypothetical protein [Micromonospora sp. NPDC005173]